MKHWTLTPPVIVGTSKCKFLGKCLGSSRREKFIHDHTKVEHGLPYVIELRLTGIRSKLRRVDLNQKFCISSQVTDFKRWQSPIWASFQRQSSGAINPLYRGSKHSKQESHNYCGLSNRTNFDSYDFIPSFLTNRCHLYALNYLLSCDQAVQYGLSYTEGHR
jgi:hypothetical protein